MNTGKRLQAVALSGAGSVIAIGTPTYGNNLGDGSSASVTLAITVADGDQCILYSFAANYTYASPPSIASVTGGGTWSSVVTAAAGTETGIEFWYCEDITSANPTITVTYSVEVPTSTFVGLEAIPLTGAGAVQAVSGTGTSSGNSGTMTSATLTPSVNGCFVVVGTGQDEGTPPATSPSSPWTADPGPEVGNVADLLPLAYQVQATAAGVSATWTSSGFGDWATVGAIIQPA